MEYVITKTYYMSILNSLRKTNKSANYKTVLEYFNKTAGLLRKIEKIRFL